MLKKPTALKPTGFKFHLGKCKIWWWEWSLALPVLREVPALASHPCCHGSGVVDVLVLEAPGDAETPKIRIWGFFHWLNCLYPRQQGWWCSWVYLLFLPAIWGTSGVRIWWRLGCLGVFNHYYYYLIVHLLWYWAGQLGSGADPPWPWAGACPALAASSSCKASPPETSPPGRRATVGILLADGGFPGYIYIIIVITIIVIIIFCCCCCRFFRLKNLLQLSPRW